MKRHSLILLSLVIVLLFSCKEKQKKLYLSPPSKSYTYAFKPLPDTILPPDTIALTAANAPQPFVLKPKSVSLNQPIGMGRFSNTDYSVTSGLTASTIQDLTIDQEGNLWIGGIGFLSKFDGTSATNFSTDNGLSNMLISAILVDSLGNLWVGNYDGLGLYKYDGSCFLPIPVHYNPENEVVGQLIEAPGGIIWGGGNRLLFSIQGDSVTRYGVKDGLPDANIRSIVFAPTRGVLVFTGTGNFIFKDGRFEPFTEIPVLVSYQSVYTDRSGNIWFWTLTTGKGQLGKYDGHTTVYFSKEQGATNPGFIKDIVEDKKGRIWIAARDELFLLHDGKLTSYPYTTIGIAEVSSMVEDETGNLWLGSFKGGLFKITAGILDKMELPQITGETAGVPQLRRGKEGVQWICLEQYLVRYAQNNTTVYDLKPILEKSYLSAFYTDKEGNVWIAIGNGYDNKSKLIRFDGEKFWVITGYKDYTNLTYINYISEDAYGNLVFLGWGGLSLFDGNRFIQYGEKQGFPSTTTKYFIDSKQRKWVGSSNKGALVFNGDSLLQFNTGNGLKSNYINNMVEDPYGNIWVATDGGVDRFDGKELAHFGHSEGLGSVVGAIAVDMEDSLIWFGSNSGLTKLPFSEINSLSPEFTTYSAANGYEFIPPLISFQQSLHLDSGRIWMEGMTNDIIGFNYKDTREFKAPKLSLKNIRIDNSNILWNLFSETENKKTDSLTLLNEYVLKFGNTPDVEKIETLHKAFGKIRFDSLQKENFIPENLRLPYTNNNIGFEFAVSSLSFGKYTRYRYKLEGYEKNWSPLSSRNEAYFGNMSEGKYTFLLEAVTPFGTTSRLSYSFTVLPPWYRTWWAYVLYIILAGGLLYAFIRWRTKALQKDKLNLEHKVNVRTNELKESLESLKATQGQLIHAEKMASLGELTAGIAHEIQNPLNFVNNFSDVNTELIGELVEEVDKKNYDEVKAIANDIKENEEKISHHGKRADAIVKGMLQHSRSSSGQKEPTDINALCDEYLRLAYHGLRAKDKSFNAKFETNFDESLPKINVVPQDIGRVVLNLINNAFYAVNEKLNAERLTQNAEGKTLNAEIYEPTVIVSTRKLSPSGELVPPGREGKGEEKIEISVKDNGNGISAYVKEKIFQPFFTTKPTGQGTGLGLSLSYDIIKAHGGELNVE
ncbi:MAG: hypothetical protein KDB99_02670, partial [Chitinophagaceae bacterium]|nr:hypothetical protein [Chitinophagaceae bacterium]